MSLFSSFRKNKQETSAEDSAYFSRAETESTATRPRKRKSANRAGADGDKAPVDPVLPEKKRARRRLVGAIALVLAVVIGLPMVLDSEPKPLPDDVTIELPSKDKPAAPVRGTSAPGSVPVPSPTPKAAATDAAHVANVAALDPKEEFIQLPPTPKAAAPVAVVPAAPPVKKPEPVAAKSESAPVKPKSEPVKPKAEPVKSTASEKIAEKSGEKAAEKSAEKAAEKSADSARAKTILEAGNDSKSTKYTVQVAALASSEKVNELRGKLKGAGISSYTQKIATDSGERIRIRIGPLNSREEADKVRAKLASLGLSGTVVPSTL